jgi:GR25 family glycosyltransferase involved in LPS biosynthesis
MKAYIIHLPHREHSVKHSQYMLNKLKEYGFDAELFEGTRGEETEKIFEKENRTLYPYSIKSRSLNREEILLLLKTDLPGDFWENYNIQIQEKYKWSEKYIAKHNSNGTRGCFHSHFRLWKLCADINEPVAIFEDDVKFFRGYTPVDFEDLLILSLGKNSFYNEPYKTWLENPNDNPKAHEWSGFSMPGASGYILKPHAAKSLVKFYRNYFMPADNAINKNILKMQITNFLMGRNTLPEEGNISDRKAKGNNK